MQHTSKRHSHLSRNALSKQTPSPLYQPQRSRCTKSQVRSPVNTRSDANQHIRVDSVALEAFLRQFSRQEDEVTSFNEPKRTESERGIAGIWNAEQEDVEADEIASAEFVNSRFDPLTQAREASSLTKLVRKPDSFDLLALIPPSAIAPYLPPLTLALDLLDIYFLEVPSAKLMFDHKSVVHRYQNSTLPHQVLFAILALASLYVSRR